MSPRLPKGLRAHGAGSALTLREHLIDAADLLLGEHPPLSLTTRDIARSAGVSDGVLYNYFVDKEELIVAAVARRLSRLGNRVEAAVPKAGTGDIGANLLQVARAVMALHAEALPLIAGLLSAPELLRRVFGSLHATPGMMPAGIMRVSEYLAAERELGRVTRSADPRVATKLLFGAIITTALGQHIANRRGSTHAGANTGLDAAIATLMSGLAPRTPDRA